MTKDEHEQASLYVLGAMSAEEAQAFEVALRSDAGLRALVRGLQRTAGLMAMAGPQLAPPVELKDKVLRRVEQASSTVRSEAQATGRPAFNFVGADAQKGWKELPVRGAWIKLLSIERDRGYAVLLGRLEPGVRYPAHEHLGAEEIYILTGDLHIGDRSLGAGDFHHADAGTSHGVNYSVEGCTLLAVLPAKHELVQFAMA